MALELLNATQICSWAPPLPQRAFQILSTGSTTEDMGFAGGASDGVRYGYVVVNTTQWQLIEGAHTPPIQAGERFLIYTASATAFPNPPAFSSGSAAVPSAANAAATQYAIDLFNVYGMTQNRENGGVQPAYITPIPVLLTAVSVQQSATGSWYIYFAPWVGSDFTITPVSMGIVTIPMPYQPIWYGQLGHVAGINYTYALPGGPDQLAFILQIQPDNRSVAMNPGRTITAHRGAECIWEGTLTEPQPASTGWTMVANGVGTYGANFAAWWQSGAAPTKTSSGWTADAPIDFAIARGMRWTNYGVGAPAGIYLGPVQDPGSINITDFLNLLCTGAALTWELVQPAGASSFPPSPWVLKVYPFPADFSGNPLVLSTPAKATQAALLPPVTSKWFRSDLLTAAARKPPDLYLINTNPIARTINADYNTVVVYYEATADTTATSTKTAAAATFSTTFATNSSSRAIHGPLEYFLDISNAGAMSQAAAAAIGQNILNKYIRANFASGFAVQPGQLINSGGVPVDLGCNWNGSMVTVQVVNEAYGGEVGMAPITFLIGEYEFDDDTQTATITPYQNARTDMASVIAALYPGKFA